MLIKLRDDLYVAADQVAEVGCETEPFMVYVRMKYGICHQAHRRQGEKIQDTAQRLAQEVNDELMEARAAAGAAKGGE